MNKPYIKVYHLVIEILSFIIIFASIATALIIASKYDGQIPLHIDVNGEVDKYGSASEMVIFPIIMMIANVTSSLIAHFLPASSFNMPFKVKPERAVSVYADTVLMLFLMELEFSVFSLFYVLTATRTEAWINYGSIVFIVILLLTIVATIVKAYKDNSYN